MIEGNKPEAVLVCVDYGDLLAVTLPRNLKHFSRVAVATAVHDEETMELCGRLRADGAPVECLVTNAFYEGAGAVFRKWAGLERAIVNCLSLDGWVCVMDADVLLPADLPLLRPDPACLYTPRRRMLENLAAWREDLDWRTVPVNPEKEFAGYFQLFHTSAPQTKEWPWYDTRWKHAGGADSYFSFRWPEELRKRPGFEVLHLGEPGKNWCGRATRRMDGKIPPAAESRLRLLQRFLKWRKLFHNHEREIIK